MRRRTFVSTLYRVQAMLSASSGNPAPLELKLDELKSDEKGAPSCSRPSLRRADRQL